MSRARANGLVVALLAALAACGPVHQDLGRDLDGGALHAVVIAAGAAHSCAIDDTGALFCWGDAHDGRLGIDARDALDSCGGLPCDGTPRLVTAITGARTVALGAFHTCVLTTDDRVRCFGGNQMGQLGRGTSDGDAHVAPVTIEVDRVQSISAGAFHTCATRFDGTVLCWGASQRDQLGVDASALERCVADDSIASYLGLPSGSDVPCATTPTAVPSILDATLVAAGGAHTCVANAAGTVSCWGAGAEGQLGSGDAPSARVTAAAVIGVTGARDLSAGARHTCAKTSLGALACWGAHERGQLGVGDTVTDACGAGGTPCSNVAIDLALTTLDAISMASVHGCARLTDGSLRCFGDATDGRLGLGTIDDTCDAPWGPPACRATPVAVLTDVLEVAAGGAHTCVIRASDHAVLCFGSNDRGQAGQVPGAPLFEATEILTPLRVAP